MIKNCNSQYVSIRLIEEWREYLDKDIIIGVAYQKSDCILRDLLIAILKLTV